MPLLLPAAAPAAVGVLGLEPIALLLLTLLLLVLVVSSERICFNNSCKYAGCAVSHRSPTLCPGVTAC
jgi:hypothetical protein